MNMIFKKPLQLILAIFLSLGLLLSPFSMAHSVSKPQETHSYEFSQLPCHEQGVIDEETKVKAPLPCCVSACVAFILPFELPILRDGNITQKPLFGLAYRLKGIEQEALIRPPMALV